MLNIFDNICLKFVSLLPDRSLLADYVTCQKSAQASLGRLGMGRKIWLWILRFKFWSNPYEKTPTLGQLSPKCQMSAGISKHLLHSCRKGLYNLKIFLQYFLIPECSLGLKLSYETCIILF